MRFLFILYAIASIALILPMSLLIFPGGTPRPQLMKKGERVIHWLSPTQKRFKNSGSYGKGWKSKLQKLSEKEYIAIHSHGYNFKKREHFSGFSFASSVSDRCQIWLYLERFPNQAYIRGDDHQFYVLYSGYKACQVDHWTISAQFIGNIFEKSRNTWKRSTHNIKRDEFQ